MYFIPVGIYLIRVRPGLMQHQVPVLAMGSITAVCSLLPISGYQGIAAFVMWVYAAGAFFFIHAAFWIWAAVKKRPAGLMMMLTPIVLILLDGYATSKNLIYWLCVVYLVCAIRAKLHREDHYDF